MLTEVHAGPYTIRGISVAGVYTCLQVPQLDAVLDVGIPLRSCAGADRIFLSHAHADHAGALVSLLSIRHLIGGERPPQLFLPAEVATEVQEALALLGRLHRTRVEVDAVPMRPGDAHPLGRELWVRAFRTHHHGPSLGYQFVRRISKLRPEHRALSAPEVARLRQAGVPGLFEEVERLELAYATDTLSDVLDSAPFVLDSRVLVLECTFAGPQRTVAQARERAHLHLDELCARAHAFRNEALVLMHFSQMNSPAQVRALVREALPASLWSRVHVFAPESGGWFG
jgi:ribonuclease Z